MYIRNGITIGGDFLRNIYEEMGDDPRCWAEPWRDEEEKRRGRERINETELFLKTSDIDKHDE